MGRKGSTAWQRALGIGNTLERDVAARLDPTTRNILEDLSRTAGLRTDQARADLIRLMRWHIGRGPQPMLEPTLDRIKLHDQAVTRRRAWELVDENRRYLPPVNEDTRPQ